MRVDVCAAGWQPAGAQLAGGGGHRGAHRSLGPGLGAWLDSAQSKLFKAAQKQRREVGSSIEELQKPHSFVKSTIKKQKSYWKSHMSEWQPFPSLSTTWDSYLLLQQHLWDKSSGPLLWGLTLDQPQSPHSGRGTGSSQSHNCAWTCAHNKY